mgnify:CR=1 FL=1
MGCSGKTLGGGEVVCVSLCLSVSQILRKIPGNYIHYIQLSNYIHYIPSLDLMPLEWFAPYSNANPWLLWHFQLSSLFFFLYFSWFLFFLSLLISHFSMKICAFFMYLLFYRLLFSNKTLEFMEALCTGHEHIVSDLVAHGAGVMQPEQWLQA